MEQSNNKQPRKVPEQDKKAHQRHLITPEAPTHLGDDHLSLKQLHIFCTLLPSLLRPLSTSSNPHFLIHFLSLSFSVSLPLPLFFFFFRILFLTLSFFTFTLFFYFFFFSSSSAPLASPSPSPTLFPFPSPLPPFLSLETKALLPAGVQESVAFSTKKATKKKFIHLAHSRPILF